MREDELKPMVLLALSESHARTGRCVLTRDLDECAEKVAAAVGQVRRHISSPTAGTGLLLSALLGQDQRLGYAEAARVAEQIAREAGIETPPGWAEDFAVHIPPSPAVHIPPSPPVHHPAMESMAAAAEAMEEVLSGPRAKRLGREALAIGAAMQVAGGDLGQDPEVVEAIVFRHLGLAGLGEQESLLVAAALSRRVPGLPLVSVARPGREP